MDAPEQSPRGRQGARSITKLTLQLVGFLIGLALLAWTLRMAFNPENQERFRQLGEAEWHEVAALVLLSLGTLAINGLIFFFALLPVRRLRVLDLQAVSAVASLLSYMPFKLSLIFRTIVHNRRDGVPLFTIAAWFGAIGVLIPAFISPIMGVASLRPKLDPAWIIMAVGGVGLVGTVIVILARVFGPGPGLERLRRWTDITGIGPLMRFVRSEPFAQMHAGIVMLSNVRAVMANGLLRMSDLVLHALRFKLAAAMLGVELSWEHAVLSGIVYFFIGATAPTGSLGFREIGTIAMAATLGITTGQSEADGFAAVVVLVTAGELTAFLIGTAAGLVWLNPLKLTRLQRISPKEPAES